MPSGDDACFRSYAGMTRIRFKGPARRHLSIVGCPPRNGTKLSFFRKPVNGYEPTAGSFRLIT